MREPDVNDIGDARTFKGMLVELINQGQHRSSTYEALVIAWEETTGKDWGYHISRNNPEVRFKT